MHIAMIGQKGAPGALGGGIERHVGEISARLRALGIAVVTYRRAWYPDDAASIPILSLRTKHLDTITHTFFATLHALWFARADVIHYHGVGPSLLAWLPRLLSPKTTVITTFHCIDRTHEKWGRLARTILALGERIAVTAAHQTIVVSKTLRDYVQTHYGRTSAYIPNGATIPTSDLRQSAPLPHGLAKQSYLLSVTRLIPHKGTEALIRAFTALPQEARHGKKLVIVGDGYYTKKYVKKIHELAQRDADILFLGARENTDLKILFTNAYAFVHVSKNEGMPIAVLEAFAAGLPTLLSDIPEHRELLDDTAYLVRLRDPRALEQSLGRLIEENAEARKHAGEKNRERVARLHDWDAITRQTIAVYRAAHPANTTISAAPSKSTS